jgi:hypothetical protein
MSRRVGGQAFGVWLDDREEQEAVDRLVNPAA